MITKQIHAVVRSLKRIQIFPALRGKRREKFMKCWYSSSFDGTTQLILVAQLVGLVKKKFAVVAARHISIKYVEANEIRQISSYQIDKIKCEGDWSQSKESLVCTIVEDYLKRSHSSSSAQYIYQDSKLIASLMQCHCT